MKCLSKFIDRIANWRGLVFFLVAYALFVALVLKNAENRINELAGKPVGVIDLTFGVDLERTSQMVAEYGDAARNYYTIVELTADLIYPIIYALLFTIILTMLFRDTQFAWISDFPLLIIVFDYVENFSIVALLNSYPKQSQLALSICEIFKMQKWLAFGLVLVLMVIGVAARLYKLSRVRAK